MKFKDLVKDQTYINKNGALFHTVERGKALLISRFVGSVYRTYDTHDKDLAAPENVSFLPEEFVR